MIYCGEFFSNGNRKVKSSMYEDLVRVATCPVFGQSGFETLCLSIGAGLSRMHICLPFDIVYFILSLIFFL